MVEWWWLLLPVVLLGFLLVVRKNAIADWQHPLLNGLMGVNRLYCRYFHRLDVAPLDIPSQGAAIVVANHISGLDPLLLLAISPRPLRFLMATEEYHRFGLSWLYRAVGCIPVDRQGRPEQAFKAALQALREGDVVAIFPQGGIQHPSEEIHRLKSGAVRLAYLTDTPIIPLHIQGVKAVGDVFLPLFLPARATIQRYPSLIANKQQSHMALQRIADCIGGAVPKA